MSEQEELTPLEIVSKITELNEISGLFKDSDVDKAMELVIRLIASPNIEFGKAPALINKLEALAAKFSMQAAYYKYLGRPGAKSEEANKKAILLSFAEDLRRLVDAVKYTAKSGF